MSDLRQGNNEGSNSSDLQMRLSEYENLLNYIKGDSTNFNDIKIKCMRILNVRDEIKQIISSNDNDYLQMRTRLKQLDSDLRRNQDKITTIIDLEEYRQLKSVPLENWWWFLKHPLDKLDWLFNLITLFSLGFSFAITVEIMSRLLSGQGDIILSIIAALQTGLTLWIGQSLLMDKPGAIINYFIRIISSKFNISKHLYAELAAVCSVIIAIIIFIIRIYLIPFISFFFNNLGIQQHYTDNPNLSKAYLFYQRSLSLNPDFIAPQYNLAEIYEQLSMDKKAKELYEKALLENYIPAYNNLGRLLILENQLSKAQVILKKGLFLSNKKDEEEMSEYELQHHLQNQYMLLKNLAWVSLKSNDNELTSKYIKEGLEISKKLEKKYGSINCLLALQLRKISKKIKNDSSLISQINPQIDNQTIICLTNVNNRELNQPEVKKWQDEVQKPIN